MTPEHDQDDPDPIFDAADYDNAPLLECDICGAMVEELTPVHDPDNEVGYDGTIEVCKQCLEEE